MQKYSYIETACSNITYKIKKPKIMKLHLKNKKNKKRNNDQS